MMATRRDVRYVECTMRHLSEWIHWQALGLLVLTGGIAIGGSACAAIAEPTDRPPNVVFILVDDLGWADLGCYGSSFYETPHIDRLAASGVRFDAAYAAGPVCSPTRASILTGKYPARLGLTDYIAPNRGNQPEQWSRVTKLKPAPYADRLALEELTLAEALREAGYATMFAGKWHLGPQGCWPEDQGFDINRGGHEGGGPYGGKKYFSPYGNPCLEDGPDGEHLPDRLAAETCAFIEGNRDRPFLAYLSFYSVHTPLMCPPELIAKYELKRARMKFDGGLWGREGQRRVRQHQDHPEYAGMVQAMDAAVGRVLDRLDELGLAENTVVVFTSDNGGLSTAEQHPTSNLPLRAGKGWLYEGGIRVPMIARAPGVTSSGAVVNSVVLSTDFYPTILELLGLSARPEQHLDGESFGATLAGESQLRGPVFWHYPHYSNQGSRPVAAVRDGNFKLHEFAEDGRLELYDLGKDHREAHNIAAEMPVRVSAMRAQLHAWQERVQAPRPSPNLDYAGK